MAASGNSIALKSFQSFAISDGLLAKVVEAVKAGEKEARTSGDVQSFEVFYKGFRQNICIGRIYAVPASVCSDRKNFPVALLYGTVVRELNLGEETADLISKKMGDSEFDEYSQADFQTIKETFFKGEDDKFTSLIIFAPSWANIRDYVYFKYTEDDAKLSNLLRHLVFSCYFDPALSSAFDALMTTVDTNKWDVTDVTPKLQYPFLSDNPLKAYPDFQKAAGVSKKAFLTHKNADEITQAELDPQELNVFESLDTALVNAMMPETETPAEAAGEAVGGDFQAPGEVTTEAESGSNDPRLGEEGSYTEVMNGENEQTEKAANATEQKPDPAKAPQKPKEKESSVTWGGNPQKEEEKEIKKQESKKEEKKPEPKKASKKVADADLIASLLTEDFTDEHDARSAKRSKKASKYEEKLDKLRKRTGIDKQADVPLTEESIFAEITEEIGEAPQVELPGESSESSGMSFSEETRAPQFEAKKEEGTGEQPKEFGEPKREEPKPESEPKAEEPKPFEKKEEPKQEAPKAEEKKEEKPEEKPVENPVEKSEKKDDEEKSKDASGDPDEHLQGEGVCKNCGNSDHNFGAKCPCACHDKSKQGSEVSGDISEAQAEVEATPADFGTSQPTENIEKFADDGGDKEPKGVHNPGEGEDDIEYARRMADAEEPSPNADDEGLAEMIIETAKLGKPENDKDINEAMKLLGHEWHVLLNKEITGDDLDESQPCFWCNDGNFDDVMQKVNEEPKDATAAAGDDLDEEIPVGNVEILSSLKEK